MSRSPAASDAPKIGCSSGAVRKSPPRPGRALGRPVVAAVRVVQRERHEPDERHRPVAPGSRSRMRSTSAASSPTASRSGPGSRRSSMRGSTVSGLVRAPGAAPARPACGRRARSGSAHRGRPRSASAATGRRCARRGGDRSPQRSSSGGQPRSSAPSRWASRTRLSMTAASASRARCRPSDAGPSRSSSSPRTDAGGRWPGTTVRRPRSSTRTRVRDAGRRLEPGDRGGRRPPGHEQLGQRIRRDGTDRREPSLDGVAIVGREMACPARRRAGPGRAPCRCRRRGASARAGPSTATPRSASQRGSAVVR